MTLLNRLQNRPTQEILDRLTAFLTENDLYEDAQVRIRCIAIPSGNGGLANFITTIQVYAEGTAPPKAQEQNQKYKHLSRLEAWDVPGKLPAIMESMSSGQYFFGQEVVGFGGAIQFTRIDQYDAEGDYSDQAGIVLFGYRANTAENLMVPNEPLAKPGLDNFSDAIVGVHNWIGIRNFFGNSDDRKGGVIISVPERRAFFGPAQLSDGKLNLRVHLGPKYRGLVSLMGTWFKDSKEVDHFGVQPAALANSFNIPPGVDVDGYEALLVDDQEYQYDRRREHFLRPERDSQPEELPFMYLPETGAVTTGMGPAGIWNPEDRLAFRPAVLPAKQQPLSSSKLPKIFETSSDSYQGIGVIGEGGPGRVFRVTDSEGTEWALKILKPDNLDIGRAKRFRNEIGFGRRNTHKNIVTIVDEGFREEGGIKCPFYVMKKYAGTLRHLMDAGLPEDKRLSVFWKILDGLESAHLQRIYHRDLKPENILCDADGDDVAIADFGIAHFAEEHLFTSIETRPGARLANFQYAAPEQRQRGATIDHRSDIYALGMILNELYTGTLLQGTQYKKIAEVFPEMAFLDDLVEKMVRQTPADRIGSVTEIKDALKIHNPLLENTGSGALLKSLEARRDSGNGMILSGVVSLPPDTELSVTLRPFMSKKIIGQSKGIVGERGKFLTEGFTNVGAPWEYGKYDVDVVAYFSQGVQPAPVLSVVGEKGLNLQPSQDLRPNDEEFPDAGVHLQAARSVTFMAELEDDGNDPGRAIQAVRQATLDVKGKGLSADNIDGCLAMFKSGGGFDPMGWSAVFKTPVWVVTLNYLNGGKSDTCDWSFDPRSKEVRYLDPKSKMLSWTPKD
ncbi:MAG TPA: serine/threonine-protein kinase [bacterium]|jgi:serine/threonine protein kinase|nr:serine/threonine-protein kinase [bacterium]